MVTVRESATRDIRTLAGLWRLYMPTGAGESAGTTFYTGVLPGTREVAGTDPNGTDTVAGLHPIFDQPFTGDHQVAYLEMNSRVFGRFDNVVGEQLGNFADFQTKTGYARYRRRWWTNLASAGGSAGKLPGHRVLTYALGDVANNLTFRMTSMFLMVYMTEIAGLPAGVAGVVYGVAKVWAGIADLVAGQTVDHFDTRRGGCAPGSCSAAPRW